MITMSSDQHPSSGPHASRAKAPPSKKTAPDLPAVLIVDDVADNLLALEAMLRRDDVEILTASSGREALEILLEREVAVAIVDVMMPEIDGLELAELIRGVDRTRRVPIIFVTAASKAEYRVFTGYESGAIDYLFKPIDDRILRAKVDVLVTLERQRRQVDVALEEAERSRAETEGLLRLALATSHCVATDCVFHPALEAIDALLAAQRCALLLVDGDGAMRFRSWRGLSESFRAALEGHSPWSADESAPRPIFLSNVEPDEDMARFRAILAAEGVGALAFVPLVVEGRLLGSFMLCWDAPLSFSPHEEELALAIASPIAQTIERSRLHEAERLGHEAARRARARAEAAEARMAFLAEASGDLSHSLDHRIALRKLAELAVGVRFADSCRIEMAAAPDGAPMPVAIVHVDPTRLELEHELRRRYPPDPRASRGVSSVLRTGRTEIYADVHDELLVEIARDPEHLRLLRERGLRSEMIVPIVAGTRPVGAIAFGVAMSRRPYDELDLVMAEELGRRAGITIENARLYEEEKRARSELEQTLRYNEIFAGILAHDLRNPLNAIRAATQLVLQRSGDGGDRIAVPLRRVLASSDRMARMIDQLLDFTRARVGGRIELEPCRADLGELCRQVVKEIEMARPEWSIRLELQGDLAGTWDPDRLLQLLSNLVTNAGQHGAPGTTIAVVLDGTAPSSVSLAVHNRGTIPESLLPNIFTPFRGTRERNSGGLGLGLFITKEIVASHDGTIDVTSTDAMGTTLAVTLPRHTKRNASLPLESGD